MVTEADSQLAYARENINAAIKSLSKIVVDKIPGHNDFNAEYQEKIANAMFDLVRIQREMGTP